MTRICIILAVFLVTVIFGMADMEIRAQRMQTILSDGGWHVAFRGISEEQRKLLFLRPEIGGLSRYQVYNYSLDQQYLLEGNEVVICGFDESFLTMFPSAGIEEGSFPSDQNGIVVTRGARKQLGLSLGDTVTLLRPDQTLKEYTVTGFTGDTSLLTVSDAFGVYMNMEAIAEFALAGWESSDDYMLYCTFKPGCNIRQALNDIRSQMGLRDEQISQNVKLLALMGQSDDSYMMKLYATAGVLAVLVIAAGVLMIAGSMNSNVAQRTEFFGLMRCLGATGQQIVRFVRFEALNWCLTAIPVGLAGATVVIWLLCAMLRFLSPGFFSGMPVLGISFIGLVLGIVVGLLTVLLAARAPARRAAKVSPLTAVSGNAGDTAKIKRAANTRLFKVYTALGIHHARGSRKNFLLMTCSFAFSIILFLAFSAAVDFMNHAIVPLKPYTPDFVVSSPGSGSFLPVGLEKELAGINGVKRVFGRMYALDMPVQVEGREETVNFISYEQYQFDWAEEYLLEGSMDEVKRGEGVLVVYISDGSIAKDSVLTFNQGTFSLRVTGVVSTGPIVSQTGGVTVIGSEELFRRITGQEGYSVIELQLNKNCMDEDVKQIRTVAGGDKIFSDLRMKNNEARGAYYSMALFIYGFLAIIAMISVFNIVNSIAMSVSAHIRQYGAMRAIGMDESQLIRMVAAEAVTYAVCGGLLGCVAGLPLNKLLFEYLVTFRWGDPWYVPAVSLAMILLIVGGALVLAVYGPARKIRKMSIADTVSAL